MGDIIYGIHPLLEALDAGRREFGKLFIAKGRTPKGVKALLDRADAKSIPIEFMGQGFFQSQLGKVNHQGVAAQVGKFPLSDEVAILNNAEKKGTLPFVLALDGIVDPQNLGSLIRTALAMGVDGIVFPKARTAPLSPAVSKASSGAMEHMRFCRVSNLVASLRRLKKDGLWVVGTDVRAGEPLDQADLSGSLALVIGGEGKGMRSLVRKTCDFVVSITQTGINSLNAAVSGAMVMYEVTRQRRAVNGH